MAITAKKTHIYLIILVAVSACLFFSKLGDMPLTDPDESFYAETAKEMLQAGEWSTPIIFGEPQFEKPVLFYWLVMIGYLVFGIGEFAARFPSALFGLAGVIGVFLLGRKLFSSFTGFISAVIMATCLEYAALARACVTDMVLTVTILYSVLFFVLAWDKRKVPYYVLSAIMAALAVLTKGPIGIMVITVAVGAYVLPLRDRRRLKEVPWVLCSAVFLVTALPWYITAYVLHGSVFIDEFFGFHNVTRFLVPEHRIGASPFFYIPVVIGGFFPWSFFLPVAFSDMYRGRKDPDAAERPCRVFLSVWILFVLLFFSASSTKLVTYIFPIFPALALVTGRYIARYLIAAEVGILPKGFKWSYAVTLGASVVGAIAGLVLLRSEYGYIHVGAIAAATVFILGLGASLALFARGRMFYSIMAVAGAIALAGVIMVGTVMPVIGEAESSRELSITVNEMASPSEELGGESDHRRGIAFYTGRTDIKDIHRFEDRNEFFKSAGRVWGIVKRKHYESLKQFVPGHISEPIAECGNDVLLTNKPAAAE
ncbi:MAG: glycosyltransferase family 39 protein [Candidatus Omnitrophica bacterium]|nr:glycosyltransferase family 39 protein [Candidatus Omnitrophota bacterium]